MKKQIPTAVLVIAILNFIGGGLGLMTPLLGLGVQAIGTARVAPAPPPPPPGGNQPFRPLTQAELEKKIEERMPYYRAVTFGGLFLDLIVSTLMVVAGVGLVKLQPWGRWLGLGYA